MNRDNIADIETNKLVSIWQKLSPNFFPKKPEIIEPNKGKNIIIYSILTF